MVFIDNDYHQKDEKMLLQNITKILLQAKEIYLLLEYSLIRKNQKTKNSELVKKLSINIKHSICASFFYL